MKKFLIVLYVSCGLSLVVHFICQSFYLWFGGAFVFLLLSIILWYEHKNALKPRDFFSFGHNTMKKFFQYHLSLEKYKKHTYVLMIVTSAIGFLWFGIALIGFLLRR